MLRHRLVQGAVGCCLLLVFWVQSGMTQDYGNRFGERQAGEVGFRTSRGECFKKRAVAC